MMGDSNNVNGLPGGAVMPIQFVRKWPAITVVFLIAIGCLWDANTHSSKAAGCTASITNIPFGNVDVLSPSPSIASGTLSINCSWGALIGLSNGNVYACVAFSTPYSMKSASGPTSLLYNLFGPPPLTSAWSSQAPIQIPAILSGVLLPTYNATATVNVPAAILANQTGTPKGVYSQSVTATVSIYLLPVCAGAPVGSATTAFQVSVTVVNSCQLSAATLNFGAFGDLNTAVSGQTALAIQCSSGIPFTIALNGGLANAVNPSQRQMTLASKSITYGLYQDPAHQTPWGSAAGSTYGGTGTASLQSIPVYGYVPVQTTPPVGTYSDTIVATVSY
jgi:spore coat protein U-like protein